MSKRDLLPQGMSFYKANLHTHSTLSDGNLTPAQLKESYQSQGYAVVAYTDHNIYHHHAELTDGNFLALAACEVNFNGKEHRPGDFSRVKTTHINLYDTDPTRRGEEKVRSILPDKDRYGDWDYVNGYLERMKELGFLACYNHPYWSLEDVNDYTSLRGLFAMEIYNHGCELEGLYGYHPQAYDEMLRTGQRLYCVATDDNHNSVPGDDPLSDSFGGFVQIAAPALTYPAIIQALTQGDFYCSTGPELREISLEGDKLRIRCSPVERIYVKTLGRKAYRSVARPGETLEEAEFTLEGGEGYLRIDCQDARGRHAYSNAYFL